jgi:hypothetical protein
MSSPPICFYSDSIPYGGSLASIVDQTYPSSMLLFRSSCVHIDRFYSKYGSMDKVKWHVINQDYCVKKDENVVGVIYLGNVGRRLRRKKSGYDPTPSNGKQLGSHAPCTRYGATAPG